MAEETKIQNNFTPGADLLKWPRITEFIYGIVRKTEQLSRSIYTENNLEPVQNDILLELLRLGGDCSYEGIIQTTYLSKGTVSKKIADMEKAARVESYFEPGSRKKKRVRILPKGETYAKNALDYVESWQRYFTEGMAAEEVKRLTEYLRSFFENASIDAERKDEFPEGWPLAAQYLVKIKARMEYEGWRYKREHGLDFSQISILIQLYYEKKPCLFKKLEKKLIMAQSGLAEQMMRLAKMDLVVCSVSGDDRRAKTAVLTEEGEDIARRLLGKMKLNEQISCRELSIDDQMEFIRLLRQAWHRVLDAEEEV